MHKTRKKRCIESFSKIFAQSSIMPLSSSVCVYFGVIEWQVLSADDEVVGCDSIWNAVHLFHLFMQKQFCLWWSNVAKIDSIWSLRKGESDIKSWISVNVFVVVVVCDKVDRYLKKKSNNMELECNICSLLEDKEAEHSWSNIHVLFKKKLNRKNG